LHQDNSADFNRNVEDSQQLQAEYTDWDNEERWNRLPRRVIRVWFLSSAISDIVVLLICAVAAGILMHLGWWGFWQRVIVCVAAILSILDLVVRPFLSRYEYAVNRFILGEHEVSIRKGWFFRNLTVVPYSRVQHVETKQGPLLRAFSLMSVEVHTAVGSHTIDALDVDDALSVVSQITAKVRIEKADL
jgi:membrane protein YdbS with pleckstrin-like domain